MPSRKRRFVVLCLQGFGDALEATPLVEQLRHNVPDALIEVVAMRPQVRDLYESLPELVDRVIYVPYWEKGILRSIPSIATLPFLTRSDASFLTFPAARAEYALFSGAIASARHYTHSYPRSRVDLILGRPNVQRVEIVEKHNVLRNLDLLRAAGFEVAVPRGYSVPKTWKSERVFPRRVLMHIGSIAHHGLEAKRWPAASFVELGKALQRKSFEVSLLSGPAERVETDRVARELSDATVISGDLPHIARTISQAGALVANDNGIAHLAAAVGTPVVALMGPTPVEFGPYGERAIAYRPSACPPCFDFVTTDARCLRNIDYACLKKDIHVSEVSDLLAHLIAADSPSDSTAKYFT